MVLLESRFGIIKNIQINIHKVWERRRIESSSISPRESLFYRLIVIKSSQLAIKYSRLPFKRIPLTLS